MRHFSFKDEKTGGKREREKKECCLVRGLVVWKRGGYLCTIGGEQRARRTKEARDKERKRQEAKTREASDKDHERQATKARKGKRQRPGQ